MPLVANFRAALDLDLQTWGDSYREQFKTDTGLDDPAQIVELASSCFQRFLCAPELPCGPGPRNPINEQCAGFLRTLGSYFAYDPLDAMNDVLRELRCPPGNIIPAGDPYPIIDVKPPDEPGATPPCPVLTCAFPWCSPPNCGPAVGSY